ncbi:WecB/TagA/CpsF family glycosyltransferase [Patescibacteria group bacterium]|nr:WecB/TagA/CpsF family glycosyltransferase [Patescibacteria group bacterium]
MNKVNKYKFLLGDFKTVANTINNKIGERKTTVILPCSLHDLAQAKNNSFYNNIDIYTTDSMWLTWWFRSKNDFIIDRVYGPNLMILILEKIKNKKFSSVFLGANSQALRNLRKKTLNKNHSQHYLLIKKSDSNKKEQEILNTIIKIQPDVLWIGIGSPKQAELATKLKIKLTKTTIFCVGAAFDFITNNKSQAPKYVQQCGLEWLFRLITEPKRLWKRYLIVIPNFIFSTIIKKLFMFNQPSRQIKK